MQQQLSDAFCSRDLVTGAFVGLNVGVIEESFAVLDSRERIANICLACTDRFDLAAFKFDTRFVALKNAIIAKRFAIGDRFSCHDAGKLRFCGPLALCCSRLQRPLSRHFTEMPRNRKGCIRWEKFRRASVSDAATAATAKFSESN